MRIERVLTHILGPAAIVGLLSSSALAELSFIGISISGNTVTNRALPAVGSNVTLPITCRGATSGPIATTGTATVSRIATNHVILSANKTAGATEGLSSSSVGIEVYSGSTQVCVVADRTAVGGLPEGVSCTGIPTSNLGFRVSAACP